MDNLWHFATRDLDSRKSILNEQKRVQGFRLLGTIYVDLIRASATGVSQSDNRVEVHFRMQQTVPPKAVLRVLYPEKFARDVALAVDKVSFGDMWPRKFSFRNNGNEIIVELPDEPLNRDIVYTFTVIVTNPPISPAARLNIWRFQTFSSVNNVLEPYDTNLDVPGFRIYGIQSLKINY